MIYHYILNLSSQRLYITIMPHIAIFSPSVVAANVVRHTYSGGSEIVTEGSRVVITCELEGNPSPSVIWWDNRTGAVIQSGVSQNDRSNLTIERADCLNTTTFIVNVSNSRGSNTHHVGLNVTCELNLIWRVSALHGFVIFIQFIHPKNMFATNGAWRSPEEWWNYPRICPRPCISPLWIFDLLESAAFLFTYYSCESKAFRCIISTGARRHCLK